MSKWLKFGINAVVVVLQIGIFFSYLVFLYPIGYLIHAFHNNTAHVILNNETFLRLFNNQQPTLAAVHSFPNWLYAILMSIGTILFALASIRFLKALIKLLNNIVKQAYFSFSNEQALQDMLGAQVISLLGNLCIASGNQITRSWLLRVNNGPASAEWADCFNDIFAIIILATIYETYRHAMSVKAENDLTV